MPDPEALVRAGRVLIDGFPVRNPASLVRRDASIVVAQPRLLAGERKLKPALDAFAVPVAGRVALDVGASTGGFTRALLSAGARRVYAVDAGHGQLLGSLRQDPRVVNLERTNLGALSRELVPETVEVITVDLSYLSLAQAVPQLGAVEIADDADLLALVKPQFELGLSKPPTPVELQEALLRAVEGISASGWYVVESTGSAIRGAHGATEFFVHARRMEEK